MEENPHLYTKDGFKIRKNCCWVFSLKTGVMIMIIADIATVIIMFVMLWYNIGHNMQIYERMIEEEK